MCARSRDGSLDLDKTRDTTTTSKDKATPRDATTSNSDTVTQTRDSRSDYKHSRNSSKDLKVTDSPARDSCRSARASASTVAQSRDTSKDSTSKHSVRLPAAELPPPDGSSVSSSNSAKQTQQGRKEYDRVSTTRRIFKHFIAYHSPKTREHVKHLICQINCTFLGIFVYF